MTAEVLDNVIHKIKTAYGISEDSYTNLPDSPIHGVGQGSQDGPSLWGVSSSVVFALCTRYDDKTRQSEGCKIIVS